MLELGWDYFQPGLFYDKAISRGLFAAKIQTGTNISFAWEAFMPGVGLSHNKTLQDQYISHMQKTFSKDSIKHVDNPYKFGSGYFNVSQFESKVYYLMDRLQNTYGTIS